MVATVSYNTVLAVQYLLIIKLNIPEAIIEKKYERIMHGIPILVWLITGIIGVACGVFNPAFFNCWIMPDREYAVDLYVPIFLCKILLPTIIFFTIAYDCILHY